MPLAKNVEKKIWDIEGFAVAVKYGDGRDRGADRNGIPQYPFDRAAHQIRR
jgi:hypothetical protein